MAGTKEIRTKIKSVQNTRKITKAMEMVAASKMRRAQERMRNARPYSEKVRNIAANLGKANPEYRPAYLVEREVKKSRRDCCDNGQRSLRWFEYQRIESFDKHNERP